LRTDAVDERKAQWDLQRDAGDADDDDAADLLVEPLRPEPARVAGWVGGVPGG
jgi:hypothetical protein